MAIYVAQEAFHYFGVDYTAGATIDTTGWSQHQIDQLVEHYPVSLQGTAGATGPAGPAGPAGPTGPAGSNLVEGAVQTEAVNYTMLATDAMVVATAAITVTLPPAAATNTSNPGKRFTVKNNSAGTVTVAPQAGTIDGAANFAMTVQYSSVDLITDGTNWFTV